MVAGNPSDRRYYVFLKYSFNYFMEEKYDFVIKMSHIKGCEDLIN
jgi:hypothetical protein